MDSGRSSGFWLRSYGAALWLLPRGLRGERAAEMAACHAAVLRAALEAGGRRAEAAAALRELADVVRTAWRLRRAGGVRGGQGNGARGRRSGMDALRQDVRYAGRGWLRRPGFAVVATLTLALGIGASTTMFTVADAALFRPLPHREPDRLAMVWSMIPGLSWRRAPLSYPNYEDMRSASRAFADMAAYTRGGAATVEAGELPERIQRSRVTANLFAVLGNGALLGRPLVSADDVPGAEPVVVVSERFWRTRLGATTGAIGRTIRVDGEPTVVVGVMPAPFAFPSAEVDLWLPLGPTVVDAERDLSFLEVVGRLAPGATVAAAAEDVSGVMNRLAQLYPEANEGVRVWVEPRHAFLVGDARPLLLVLLGAVGLVLVIACANLANLLLARGATRGRELAVRSALGAGRGRLVRQLLTESLLLGLLGGVAGVMLAWASTGLLLRLAPGAVPRGETIGVDVRALAFATAISLACGLAVGLLPALRTARWTPVSSLRDGRGGTAGRARHRLQRALVVAQISLALVLLVGAGLLVRSLNLLLSVDPGFRPDGLITMSVALPDARYPDRTDAGRFYEELLTRVHALPGVSSAAAVWALPFAGSWASGGAYPEGAPGDTALIGMLPVRGDAFGTLGTRIVAGRTYTRADEAADANVVVVNEALARRFWPGQDAVGKRFRRGRPAEARPLQTVIGVVADVKRTNLGADADPEAYFYHTHDEGAWARDMHIVVRADGDPLALATPLRRAVHALDPELATGAIRTLPELIERSAAGPRIRTLLATTFAALAALLAVIGIYGVMAFAVNERRREIGVRMALGARSGGVLAAVLREGAGLAAAGVALGLLGALAATRLLASALFGVSPLDARTYAGMAALLAAAALAACWIPARRAARVDPLVALRAD